MKSDLIKHDPFVTMNEVANLYITGTRDPYKIARELKVPVAEVREYIDEWRKVIASDDVAKERAREAVHTMDAHFDLLIKAAYEVIETVNTSGSSAAPMLGQKTGAIKIISELETKRLDALQRAGLLDDAAAGAEMAAMEEKHATLIRILKEVTAHCDKCRPEVARRLSAVTGQVEPL